MRRWRCRRVNISSAMRPPIVMTSMARASLRWVEYSSPSGRYIVDAESLAARDDRDLVERVERDRG